MYFIQRIITDMHTLPQVTVGFILGFIYSYLYITLNGWYSSIIILFIGLILIFLIIHKIDKYVYGPIPDWVDKDMLSSIYKKQDSPWYSKILHILANSYLHARTFMSWKDVIIYKIQESGIKYDAVVGIKTGGAIISDYKVKLTRSEYKCNKKPNDMFNDIYKNYGDYAICKGIDNNLKGYNIILIDELVGSRTTMENMIKK